MQGPFAKVIAFVLVAAVAGGVGYYAFNRQIDTSNSDDTVGKGDGPDSGPEDDRPKLSKPQREYIAKAEFYAFQILYKAGPQFKGAVVNKDRAALRQFFSDGFQGKVFSTPLKKPAEDSFVAFDSIDEGTAERVDVDADEFTAWLLEKVSLFSTTPQVKLQLIRLSPIDENELEKAWKGTFALTLTGETGDSKDLGKAPESSIDELFPPQYQLGAGRPLEISMNGYFEVRKFPEDIKQGGWISRWDIERVSSAECARQTFLDVTAESGVNTEEMYDNWKEKRSNFVPVTGGVFCTDYNTDGLTDILILDHKLLRLYEGLGNFQFKDVTAEVGLPPSKGEKSAGFADVDNDGDQDLFVAGRIFENRNAYFMDRGPSIDLNAALAFADFDRDGLIDVYGSFDAPPPSPGKKDERVSWIDDQSGRSNQLWRNKGNFRFEDVTEKANASGGKRSTFTSVWLDVDNDLWPDIYAINELGGNVLLHNQKDGTFASVQAGPVHDGFAMGVDCGDVNNDGRVDIYVGNMKSKMGQRIVGNVPDGVYTPETMSQLHRWVDGNILLANNGELKFSEQSSGISGGGWTYGTSLFDMNGDGWLDIYSTCGFASFHRGEPDG